MTLDDLEQWEAQTDALIAAEMQALQLRAGSGVVITGNSVALQPRASLPEPPPLPDWVIGIVAVSGEDRWREVATVPRSGGLSAPFAWSLGRAIPNDPLGASEFEPPPFVVSFEALAFANDDTSHQSGRYVFPVRITLIQYKQYAQNEAYREEPLRTYTLDLHRGSQTLSFSAINADGLRLPEIVRLVKVERI